MKLNLDLSKISAKSLQLPNIEINILSTILIVLTLDYFSRVEFDYCSLVPWIKARSDLLFDLENNAAVTPDKFMNHVKHFKTNGIYSHFLPILDKNILVNKIY